MLSPLLIPGITSARINYSHHASASVWASHGYTLSILTFALIRHQFSVMRWHKLCHLPSWGQEIGDVSMTSWHSQQVALEDDTYPMAAAEVKYDHNSPDWRQEKLPWLTALLVTLIWSSCHLSLSHVILILLLLLTITMTPMSGHMIVHSGNIIIVPTPAWRL